MGHKDIHPVRMSSLQALLRRNGIFQGPRLIAAVLVVVVLLFYISGPSNNGPAAEPPPKSIPATHPAYQAPRPNHGGHDIVSEATANHNREKNKDKLSDRIFEYLGSPKGTSKPAAVVESAAEEVEDPNALAGVDLEDPVCKVLSKGTKDLLVVVKTPAHDIYSQLPTRFLSNLKCAPLMLFSYIPHTIGSYVVHDALANVTHKARDKSRDFELYYKLQVAQKAFQEFATLTEDPEHNLDRWAIVPSLVAAYNAHPNKKWFVYIEGDTYLSLPNLLAWVGQLDPNVPFYAGAQTMLGEVELGSSAAGIVLSRAAVAKLARGYKTHKMDWERLSASRCCGDQVLAEALIQSNVTLHRAWPNIQGDSPLSIEWDKRHWCRAAVTWHRMTPPLMDMLWQYERDWTMKHDTARREQADAVKAATPPPVPTKGWFKREIKPAVIAASSTASPAAAATATPGPLYDFTSSIGIPPLLYKDYFEGFMTPLLLSASNRSDWDNHASDNTYTSSSRHSNYAHSDPKTCRAACDVRPNCVQWTHEPNKCRLGMSIKFGAPVTVDLRMNAGWVIPRVEEFARGMGRCRSDDAFFMPKMGAGDQEQDDEVDGEEPELLLGPDEGEEASPLLQELDTGSELPPDVDAEETKPDDDASGLVDGGPRIW